MTYSEPTPEQETGEQDAAEQSVEPGKKQGDPLLDETEGGDDSDAGTEPSTSD